MLPREKLLQLGAEYLNNQELLAIFLRTGIKGCPVLSLANLVLHEFAGLRPLFNADLKEFCRIKGLGPTQYIQLQAAKEIVKRYLNEELQQAQEGLQFERAKQLVQSILELREQEIFVVLFLNNQHLLIKYEEMFRGSINNATVYPREIVKAALACNAAAIILGHNHPSGILKPSEEDKGITKQIIRACELVDIRVLDHFIVGNGGYFSFYEHGIIENK